MTPEAPHSKFHFNPEELLSEIPLPTEVTEEVLEKIIASRKQGKSPAASVAECIIEEASSLYNFQVVPQGSEAEELVRQEATAIARMYVQILFASSYASAARALLSAEKVIENGEPLSPTEKWPKVPGYKMTYLFPADEVAQYLSETHLGDVLKTKSPLEFVDFYTNKQLNSSDNQNVVPQEGLKRGQQRFHQLYHAAQQAGI